MAITVPTVPADLTEGDVASGETMVIGAGSETDPQDVAEAQHWLYAYAGTRVAGRYWTPTWTTTSGSLTINSDNDADNLDQWRPQHRALRDEDDTDPYAFALIVFGQEVTVEWSIIRRDPDGTRHLVNQPTFTQGSGTDWFGIVARQTEAQISKDGTASNRPVRLEHKLRASADEEGLTSQIYQTCLYADTLQGSEIVKR